MSFFQLHAAEIKFKLIYLFLSFVFCILTSFQFPDAIYYIFVKPFLIVDANRSFLFTDMREGFQTTLSLILVTSFFFTTPYAIYLFWTFWKPALYTNEIQYTSKILWCFWFMSCTFITHKYFLPFLWQFFINFEMSSGLVQIYLEATIQAYFRFTFQIWACISLFLFLPWIVRKAAKRRLSIWFASVFLISFFSPPDFLIQFMLTFNLFLFFEVIFFIRSLEVVYFDSK